MKPGFIKIYNTYQYMKTVKTPEPLKVTNI